jgi:hypothetical protein
MQVFLSSLLWFGIIVVTQWVASLVFERNMRKRAKRMADVTIQESDMISDIVLVVEDLQRFMPEKEEILALARVNLLTAQENLRDMSAVLRIESSKKPIILQYPRLLRLASRAIPRYFRSRRQMRDFRRLTSEESE